VINNMAALKRRGAMDDKDVKALIEQKIAESATDKRVSTMKAKKAIEVAHLDEETERILTEVTDKRVADKVEIKRPTALFVDKSSSMTQAIGVAKQLAALVSAVISADFRVYAFDSAAFEVKTDVKGDRRPALSDWEKAFKFIKANGSTSVGSALMKMLREKFYAENLVIVTDEGENTAPYLKDAYTEYTEVMKVAPSIIIVQVGGANHSFVTALQGRGIEVMRYQINITEHYALANVLPLLAMPSKAELVDLIMGYALPQRSKPIGQMA
jgi:hypothetical protein